jgi:hypothetical protein
MAWWPRQTPTGFLPAKARIMSQDTPASAASTGPGEIISAVGIQRERFLHRDLVVAVHLLVHAQLPEVLDQVVGERIVVIDDQQHVRTICPALGSVKERRPRVNK